MEITRIRVVEIFRTLLTIREVSLWLNSPERSHVHVSTGEGSYQTTYRHRILRAAVDPRHECQSNRVCMEMAMTHSRRCKDNQVRGGREEAGSCPESRVLASSNLSTGVVTIGETHNDSWNRPRRRHCFRSRRRYEVALFSTTALR